MKPLVRAFTAFTGPSSGPPPCLNVGPAGWCATRRPALEWEVETRLGFPAIGGERGPSGEAGATGRGEGRTMRRASTVLLAMLLVSTLGASAALAVSPHFIGDPTISKSTTTGLTVTWKAAGLGNVASAAFLTADRVEATYECVNRGGNVAPGQPLVFEDVTGPTTNIPPSNGQITFTVTLPVPPTPSSRDVCPNGNWTVRLTSLTYFNVVVHIQQDGMDILTGPLGDIDP